MFIERNYQREFRRWMLILFWVVLILFSVVQSKIVHYSSLCYFPLTYLAALTLMQLEERKIQFSIWLTALGITISISMLMRRPSHAKLLSR